MCHLLELPLIWAASVDGTAYFKFGMTSGDVHLGVIFRVVTRDAKPSGLLVLVLQLGRCLCWGRRLSLLTTCLPLKPPLFLRLVPPSPSVHLRHLTTHVTTFPTSFSCSLPPRSNSRFPSCASRAIFPFVVRECRLAPLRHCSYPLLACCASALVFPRCPRIAKSRKVMSAFVNS